MTGAIIAFTRGAISLAIATGIIISVPFAVTPCGSNVPNGNNTVSILDGTSSPNSIQLMRSISRVIDVAFFMEFSLTLMLVGRDSVEPQKQLPRPNSYFLP